MLIRTETETDIPAIREIVTEAMRLLPQSTGTEAEIVERLRAADALALSLVAEEAGRPLGYLAVSEGQIGTERGWAVIGPLAVLPARHGEGIGSALMAEALRRLRSRYKGAVLVGEPGYYGRFGFRAVPGLTVGECPPRYIQALPFGDAMPRGEVIHHAAFGLEQPL
jgi:putative acetyltransferase